MGNSDNWTTPKQLKIEREGEPRGTRRGPLKKGERRKGTKARLDELRSALRNWKQSSEWLESTRQRERNSGWVKHNEEWVVRTKSKLDEIRAAMVRDGLDTDGL